MTQFNSKERVVQVYVSSEDEAAYDHMIDVLANAVYDLNEVELEGIIAEAWGNKHDDE